MKADSLLPVPALVTYGSVAILDDEGDCAESLKLLLASNCYGTSVFTNVGDLHAHLAAVLPAFKQERRMLVDVWRAQLEGSGTVAELALKFFAREDRFEIPLVLVTDYAMPGEHGISVCSRYQYEGLERVLLTGVADHSVAVDAFNAGVIEQFVQKQALNYPQGLIDAVRGRLLHSAARRASLLAAELPPDLVEVLARPEACSAIRGLLHQYNVREYLMLAGPQGMLGVTDEGRAVWIQLETDSSLAALEEVLELAGVAPAVRRRVRQGGSLVAADWMRQIGAELIEQDACVLSREPRLLAAVHHLELPASLSPTRPMKKK